MRIPLALAAIAALLLVPAPAHAAVPLLQVSSDPYAGEIGQHNTEVEPDTFMWGSTIVSAFQAGRVFDGGSTNIGWATSKDGGVTWTRDFLPKTTSVTQGPYWKTTDPVVAFDVRHNVWLISFMGIVSPTEAHVLTSRSTNGGTNWSKPVVTATGHNDKNWIACDNRTTSPFHGTCYTSFSDLNANRVKVTRSTNGGQNWDAPKQAADGANGFTGGIAIQPNGNVHIVYLNPAKNAARTFRSTNGGASWLASTLVATYQHHLHAGGLRDWPLPSLEVDGVGRIYVAWSDCRFRLGCPTNDIVLSESNDGVAWDAPYRVPLDLILGARDHMYPGLGVDPNSAGASVRIGVTYYFYGNAACTAATCSVNVGFISSVNGGASWSTTTHVAGPMTGLALWPNTSQGRMITDYLSTSVSGARAHTVIPVAKPVPFDVAMYYPIGALPVVGGNVLPI